ncbi:meiotic recombination protein DMC1 [Paramyrothecium foliicola]|nr:meiotic recombination protein DMC1 [Paramyrothecium foliicola]
MDHSSEDGPGGFFPPTGLPSPAPSNASSRIGGGLPHPRSRALQPGSKKEDMVRRYVEERLLHISRRYVKKFGNPEPGDTVIGYKSFSETARDLKGVVDVLWLSGTPSLQIPFLLRLASDFTQYVRSFPPSPRESFDLLSKLDHCFASLLLGQDIESQETLPGFENGLRAGMTTTDMVRCRSLVEQTRVLMVEVLSGTPDDEDEEDETGQDDEETESELDNRPIDTDGMRANNWDIDEERLHLDSARIYEKTIVQLGNRLGDTLGEGNMTVD